MLDTDPIMLVEDDLIWYKPSDASASSITLANAKARGQITPTVE